MISITRWLYPRIRNPRKVIFFAAIGFFIGGIYGAINDQVSYSLSPDYFTAFKFYQFEYLDFGWPERAFVGVIGFWASCWVGAFVGWLLARIRFYSDDLKKAYSDVFKGLAIVFFTTIALSAIGLSVGYLQEFSYPSHEFLGFESVLDNEKLNRFVLVGYMHNFGYLGCFCT